jgi:hypothetical protein
VAYSNLGRTGTGTVEKLASAVFHGGGQTSSGPAAALPVRLNAREVQILVPV